MSKTYKQIDWAMDRLAKTDWIEAEDRLMDRINYWETKRKKSRRAER